MKYIVLLRKINVGKENRVSMKILEDVFVSLGYKEVETYINSGNVIFKTTKSKSGIINELPIRKEFVKIIYVKGAVIWNVTRKNLMKSQLSKIAGSKLYQQMTIRNVNTARHLANISD